MATLAILGILAAIALISGTIAVIATPAAFAQGDTKVIQKNKGKSNVSGFGNTGGNFQANLCCVFNATIGG